ncbi:DNA polymerase V [Neofusicoccum parvum]|nr:DNA polymerase V [Neofusicoccum parvum]
MSRKRNLDAAAQDAPANGQKRRKQYTEQDAELARIFDRLADEARDVRLGAAKELVLKLSSDPAAELANKVIVRLIRGLNSGRKAARFGFFVALSEVLRQLYSPASKEIPGLEPNIHGLVKLVAELTTVEGKATGQEKRDHLLGRVFGYKAIIQSSILVHPNAPEECWANVLEQLFKLAREKPWLHGLCSDGLAKTPEGVAIWLTVQSVFPDMELPQGIWHKQDPLHTKERQTLANVMKENFSKTSDGAAEGGKKVKSGSSGATLNFAWDAVISSFLQKNAEESSEKNQSKLANFWTDIVDNNLFSASASSEQKSKGFQLFSRMLGNTPTWTLPSLFSPNLMRCLINQRNDSERILHNAAKAPLDEMRARAKKTPEAAAPILEALITKHGSLNFDQITKNKTVDGVLGHANDVALENIVPLLKRLIYRPEEQDEKAAEAQRRTVADMLVSVVRSRNKETPIGTNDSWLQSLLNFLTELAYFTPTASSSPDDLPIPAVSEASRTMFQGRLTSCLAHLLSSKLDTDMQYPYIVVSAIRSKSKSSKNLALAFQADKTISRAVKQAHKQVEEVAGKTLKAKDKKKPALRAFKLLFSLTIIQVYNGDPDAVSILEELEACYDSAFQKNADANAFQQLTEVLLSFAAKPSVLFRKLSEQVFTVFASELTAEGLQSMIDILSKKESMSGQQDLFDQQGSEDEGEGEEEEGSDGDEEDSDVEMVEAEEVDDEEDEGSDDDDDDDDDDDEGSDDDSDEEDEEELERFNAALAKTLNMSGPTGEGEESGDDDEADMDDDQMMALEPHLAKIFKQRQEAANKSKKKDNKDAKATMINFKNRVLDLLLIYVKQQHANPLALDVIMPLLQLIRQTKAKQLAEKSTNLLKQYFDATKKAMPMLEDDDVDRVWELLEDIHTEVTKDASKLHAGACSRASLFVAKVLVAKDKEDSEAENYGRVADVYSRTQKQWYADPKSQLHPSFFNEWINWSVATRKNK